MSPRPSRAMRVELALFRAGAAAAAILPAEAGRQVAEAIAVAVARVPLPAGVSVARGVRRRRALVASHLRTIYGPDLGDRELAVRVDDVFASYGRYWAESLRLPSLTAAELEAGVSFEGFERVEEAMAAGRGLIFAAPHLGGWEWGGALMAARGYRMSVVAEALASPEIFEWFASFRRNLGFEVIRAGPDAGRACLRALADNRILCLLCDRMVGDAAVVAAPGVAARGLAAPGVGALGVEVELFGVTTRLPAGPVTLALRTGATILPGAFYFGRRASQHEAVVRPPLALARAGRFRDDVVAGTQALARELELLIRRAPTQWHLMQPYWPGDP